MLPQLAVSAKILCLLMVVICGTAPTPVRSVRLYNACSGGDLQVLPNGRVWANQSTEQRGHESYNNLTMRAMDLNMELSIFAEESQLYLCFNKRGRLMGSKKNRGRMCLFHEHIINGYNRYSSVANPNVSIGFTRIGRPLRTPTNASRMRCLNFVKYDNEFSIIDHNKKIAGGIASNDHKGPYVKKQIDGKKPKMKKVEIKTNAKMRHSHKKKV